MVNNGMFMLINMLPQKVTSNNSFVQYSLKYIFYYFFQKTDKMREVKNMAGRREAATVTCGVLSTDFR